MKTQHSDFLSNVKSIEKFNHFEEVAIKAIKETQTKGLHTFNIDNKPIKKSGNLVYINSFKILNELELINLLMKTDQYMNKPKNIYFMLIEVIGQKYFEIELHRYFKDKKEAAFFAVLSNKEVYLLDKEAYQIIE